MAPFLTLCQVLEITSSLRFSKYNNSRREKGRQQAHRILNFDIQLLLIICLSGFMASHSLIMIRQMHSARTFGGAAKLYILRDQAWDSFNFRIRSTSFLFFIVPCPQRQPYFKFSSFRTNENFLQLCCQNLSPLNQPRAFCLACGKTLVLPCSSFSSSSSVLRCLLITSQDVT